MKTKEELQKYIREEVTNPIIGKFIMDMTDKGISYEDTMQMAKILIDNTPNVEKKMVADHLVENSIIDEDANIITSKIERFNRIGEENGFKTSWCLYEITALSLKSPLKGKWMSNGTNNDIRVKLPNRKLTGLELWKYADELYNKLNDTEHLFIESFNQNDDTIEVFFGS